MNVADPLFGQSVDIVNPISEALAVAPQLKSTDTALLMLDRYETTYGIYDHVNNDPNRPLALVAMHPAEDSSTGSLLYESMEMFAELRITKHFGLSYTEYLELPTDYCRELRRIAAKMERTEGRVAQDIMNQLEDR